MKFYKLLFLTLLSCFALSCSEDKIDERSNDSESRVAESQFDNSYLGVYKGLFSTNDGLTRGSVVLTLYPTNQAAARITLSSGEIIELKSSKVKLTVDNNIDNLRFSSTGLSNIDALLNFSVEGNGANPVISNVTFENKQSDILIAKNLSRAPLNTITGTYARTAGTGGFSSSNRTWNVMAIGSGNQTYATQIFYGNRIFTTMPSGTQSNCSNSGDFATCDIDGSARILGYDVTWTGTHTYDRYTDNTACSEVSGTWSAPAYGGSSGTFISDTDCSNTSISNDFCEDALTIGLGETKVGFTNAFGFVATDGDTPVGNCDDNLAGSANGIGVWYTFTSPIDGNVIVDLSGSDFDTQLRVFSGTCGALVCEGNDDDNGLGGDFLQSLLTYTASQNETYYIFIGGYNASSGNFTLNVRLAPAVPPNDLCGGATVIACGGSESLNTTLATFNDSTIDCSSNIFGFQDPAGVWYTYTATSNQDVTVTTINSDYDTNLKVFSGSCGALTCIDNNDDIDFPDFPQSEVTFSATTGETYYFYVGGYNDATGNLVIDVSCVSGRNSLNSANRTLMTGKTKAEYYGNKNLNAQRGEFKLKNNKNKKAK